jgi:hypothetical protein
MASCSGKAIQPKPTDQHFTAYRRAADCSANTAYIICLRVLGFVSVLCREAYEQQLAAAGGDPSAVAASLPSGIIVFRQGKPTHQPHFGYAKAAD